MNHTSFHHNHKYFHSTKRLILPACNCMFSHSILQIQQILRFFLRIHAFSSLSGFFCFTPVGDWIKNSQTPFLMKRFVI